ncbi:MAG: alpha/beta hydrolase [Rhodoferax sp.]|jgi:pimeloyl-ACP methyl ester carboxylesterase|nr:alpha/beta hydrolase [Rhodoferax sp.]
MAFASELAQFPLATVDTAAGRVAWRAAAAPGYDGPVTQVLLHGIGSASASWLQQLRQVAAGTVPASRVLAWDAPGYGDSTPLPAAVPTARDYAQRLWAWLDALGATHPLVLVGHSLGALMAAAAVALQPQRVQRLVLLAPAQGHARLDAAERQKKLDDRLATLARLGPAGMAERRAAAMLSPQARPEQVAFVAQVMAAIDPAGYTQAAHMLSQGDIDADLAGLRCPVHVAGGSADTVTPAAGCQALARRIGAGWTDLGPVGHSCPLEAAAAVNRLIGLDAGATP